MKKLKDFIQSTKSQERYASYSGFEATITNLGKKVPDEHSFFRGQFAYQYGFELHIRAYATMTERQYNEGGREQILNLLYAELHDKLLSDVELKIRRAIAESYNGNWRQVVEILESAIKDMRPEAL